MVMVIGMVMLMVMVMVILMVMATSYPTFHCPGTVNALSTFNFLAAEGRVVVGERLSVDDV